MAYLVDEWVVLYWVHLQVMEQFFSLVNMFLQNHRDTSERRLRIRTYKVETKFMNLNLIKRFAPFLFIIVLRYLHVHLSFSLYLLCSLHKILTSLCNLGCSLHPKCWCCWMGKRDCSSCWISCGKVFCVHGSCYFMQYTLQMLYIYVVFFPFGPYSTRSGGAHGRYGTGDWTYHQCRETMTNVCLLVELF